MLALHYWAARVAAECWGHSYLGIVPYDGIRAEWEETNQLGSHGKILDAGLYCSVGAAVKNVHSMWRWNRKEQTGNKANP